MAQETGTRTLDRAEFEAWLERQPEDQWYRRRSVYRCPVASWLRATGSPPANVQPYEWSADAEGPTYEWHYLPDWCVEFVRLIDDSWHESVRGREALEILRGIP